MPDGLRGSGQGNAVRYWVVSGSDYLAKADVWPLDPQGELLNMIQIENKLGIANVEEIAKVPGGQHADGGAWRPRHGLRRRCRATEEAIQTVPHAATAAGLPCAITANAGDVERRIQEGFKVLVGNHEMIAVGRRAAGRWCK